MHERSVDLVTEEHIGEQSPAARVWPTGSSAADIEHGIFVKLASSDVV
jgi:hypothetical protein